uniref:GC vitamin D binding protein n=1 Tax=Myotis myotis TaxID=51298 RepID=A0A7J8AK01_MYOMY|nr:GC vitamin D binding protein [Myotis myotis]
MISLGTVVKKEHPWTYLCVSTSRQLLSRQSCQKLRCPQVKMCVARETPKPWTGIHLNYLGELTSQKYFSVKYLSQPSKAWENAVTLKILQSVLMLRFHN